MNSDENAPAPSETEERWYRPIHPRKARRPETDLSPEERIASLESTVAELQRDVASLRSRRYQDDPAIEHAAWERRRHETGQVVAAILLGIMAVVWLIKGLW